MASEVYDSNVSSMTTPVPQDVGVTVKPYYLYWQFEVYNAVFLYVPPFLLVLGTLGNVLAIVVLLSREMRKSGINLILTVMAMADICLLYTSELRIWILFISKGTVDMRALNLHTCQFHMFFTFFSVHLSSMSLALVTIVRVISVCVPLKARDWCSRGKIIKAMIALLILLGGIDIPTFFTVSFEQTNLANIDHKCFYRDQVQDNYYILITAFISYVPFTIIFFGNVIIIYKLMSAGRKRASKMPHVNASSVKTNTSAMLIAISLFFFITNLPYSVWANGRNKHWPMTSADQELRVNSMLSYAILYQMSVLNNSCNFLLYCTFGQAFRNAFVAVILRWPASNAINDNA